ERRRDLLIDEQGLFDFYDERIPETVTSARHFDSWWKRTRGEQPDLLSFTTELLLPRAEELDPGAFPDTWHQGDLTLPLTYQFEPGTELDGVCVHIPIAVLAQVRPDGFDWMVPGLLDELAVATIRALPKRLRTRLVPAPDTAAQIVEELPEWSQVAPAPQGAPSFLAAFAAAARELRQVEVTEEDVDVDRLPAHLRMLFQVHDERGQVLGTSRELVLLQRQLAQKCAAAGRDAVRGALHAVSGSSDDGAARPSDPRTRGRGRAGEQGAGPGGSGPAGSAPAGAGGPGGRAGAGVTSPGLAEVGGLTGWPEPGHVPTTVTSTGPGGLEVRGYPALVAEGATVGLRVLTDAARQAIEHRGGVARLLGLRLGLPTARITSRWNSMQSLTLAASPYRSTDALVADLQAAAVASLTAGHDLARVRARDAFEEPADSLRDSVEDEVQRLAALAATIQTRSRELEQTIKKTTSMALLNVLTDVRDQHEALVH